MPRKKILFIGGSLNQTKMGHAVAKHLVTKYDCYFSPMYCDGYLKLLADRGWLDFTVIGGRARVETEAYFAQHGLPVDYGGEKHNYDLVVTGSDLIVQKNLHDKKVVLIQEGMTDPENFMYYLVKWFKLPRYLASTSTNGLSNAYDLFCVASEGYRDFFAQKGVKKEKMVVTGMPNYDNVAQFLVNDFPYRHYVLAATSDARETFKLDDRKQFIQRAVEIANGRPLIFKLHPNENEKRSIREIKAIAPNALVYAYGNTEHMIANCDVLITQYSTVVYIGIALGKEVYSYFDVDTLKRLAPIQNGGTSGQKIANYCCQLLEGNMIEAKKEIPTYANA